MLKMKSRKSIVFTFILTHFFLGGMCQMLCALDLPSLDSNKFVITPTSLYFPHSLRSLWVYEDQDGNEFIRRAIEDEEIAGKRYRTFSYEPELADKTFYSLYIYPTLYHATGGGNLVMLCGAEVAASIKARLTKEIEVFTSDPEVVGPAADDLAVEVQGNDHLLFLPVTLVEDTPWEVNKIEAKITNNDFDEGASFSFTITETGHVLGTETIKTHAGTFKDCLKVEYRTETKATITPAPPPEEVELPGETITTVWFARGIGIVKYHQKSDPIFLSMIPANALELDIATLLPPMERTLELKEVDIK